MRYYIIKHVESGMFYLQSGKGMTEDRAKAYPYAAGQLKGCIGRWLKDGTLRLIPVSEVKSES